VVAAEFVCSSITSDSAPHEMFARTLPDNPHIRFMEARRRGYGRCTVERRRWTTDFRAVSTVLQRDAAIETIASFAVEAGKPGLA
jgi:alkaline phosphatase D